MAGERCRAPAVIPEGPFVRTGSKPYRTKDVTTTNNVEPVKSLLRLRSTSVPEQVRPTEFGLIMGSSKESPVSGVGVIWVDDGRWTVLTQIRFLRSCARCHHVLKQRVCTISARNAPRVDPSQSGNRGGIRNGNERQREEIKTIHGRSRSQREGDETIHGGSREQRKPRGSKD